MPKSNQKAAKNKADALFSLIVRSIGYCEVCGVSGSMAQLQCAHWIGRTASNTRTDFDNAFSLCARCHFAMTDDPTAWSEWAIAKRGRETYQRLREAANEHSKMDWPAEVERLKTFLKGVEL